MLLVMINVACQRNRRTARMTRRLFNRPESASEREQERRIIISLLDEAGILKTILAGAVAMIAAGTGQAACRARPTAVDLGRERVQGETECPGSPMMSARRNWNSTRCRGREPNRASPAGAIVLGSSWLIACRVSSGEIRRSNLENSRRA
jgi:hypothetical protein